MKNRIGTAQGAAEYTMGIKFQMLLEINEAFIETLHKKKNRTYGAVMVAAGLLFCLGAVPFCLKGMIGGSILLPVGIVIGIMGGTSRSWIPKAEMFLLRAQKKDGTFKITVYDTEFLIYSEQYQTCQTISLRDMKSWDKEEGIYRLHFPGKIFAFREGDFLSGNAAAFEMFLNEINRKII